MEMEEIAQRLAMIDSKMEHVEEMCKTLNERLFTGDGESDSLVTRLRLAEREIKDLKEESDENRKGKFAVIMVFISGFVSIMTSLGMKYLN